MAFRLTRSFYMLFMLLLVGLLSIFVYYSKFTLTVSRVSERSGKNPIIIDGYFQDSEKKQPVRMP